MRLTFSAAVAALALTACGFENQNERLADRVTAAIVANDMRPVEKDFNALDRPKLESRANVGRLSDRLNALGTFKRTHETTPRDARAGYHTFVADFSKGTMVEDMTFDADGKIAGFHVRPPSSGGTESSD